jgi:adenylosuccinate synthase
MMKGRLAERIRSDANEYGATTKRPRDIAYFDLPMISYFMKVGGVDFLAITHLDISYSEVPIKVCVGYEVNKKSVEYQPDQDFLDKVKPKYIELPAWDGAAAAKARSLSQLPMEALQYVAFICQSLGVKPLIGTVGPKRDQTIFWY